MKLFYRAFGQGRPLIVLHGLFGMSDNWLSIGRRLSEYFHVYLLDLRNHGQSPHDAAFNYSVMTSDVVEFMEEHQLQAPLVLGHSMGGKVAMNLALNYDPDISGLIVVDIAPRAYHHTHFKDFLESLLSLDLTKFKTRMEIDRHLAQKIPQPAIRQFLLKNLKRLENNRFVWKLNLPAIYNNLEHVLSAITASTTFDGPALFLKGEHSTYISEEDVPNIKRLFPRAEIRLIKGASHWVHADAPEQLLSEIVDFGQRTGGAHVY